MYHVQHMVLYTEMDWPLGEPVCTRVQQVRHDCRRLPSVTARELKVLSIGCCAGAGVYDEEVNSRFVPVDFVCVNV